MVVYGGRLPAPRRLIVSGLSATAIGEQSGWMEGHYCREPCHLPHLPPPPSPPAVLGGNLAGVTSWLLGRDGGRFAAATRLDMLVPVAGFKRCLDAQVSRAY